MNSSLPALQTSAAHGLPSHGLPAHAGRWLEVLSHLDPKYGGLSSAVPALGRRMAVEHGLEITLAGFCVPSERFCPVDYDQDHLNFWPHSRKIWLQDRLDQRALRTCLLAEIARQDGVHIHGLWEQSTAIAASLARAARKPYILSAHGMLEPWALGQKRVKKWLYAGLVERRNVAHAACLHALTIAEATQLQRFGARSPIAIIPNGVDIPQTRDPLLFLNAYPALHNKRILLFLGRLHPKKGLDLLINAWASLADRFPDFHLVLAGPDSEKTQARLQAVLEAQGLTHTVLFTGMLQGDLKWSALAAAEAFLLPSFSEGLSMSVLEAMGMGLPVLVTESCNMPEVVSQQCGWQIKPSVAALTEALRELMSNSTFRNHALGLRASALIERRYRWSTVACQMAELYQWAAGSGPKPQSFEILRPI